MKDNTLILMLSTIIKPKTMTNITEEKEITTFDEGSTIQSKGNPIKPKIILNLNTLLISDIIPDTIIFDTKESNELPCLLLFSSILTK